MLLIAAAALLAACAAPQTREVMRARDSFPPRALLQVPFYPQTDFQCGPAALAGVLQFHGMKASPAELGREVFLPARRGSLQAEIGAAVRQRDLLAYPLHDDGAPALEALLRALEAGYPALVLQDLGVGPWSQWHYAVAVGFDLDDGVIVLNSGASRGHRMSLAAFETTWRRADYWALVACDPSRVPPFASAGTWNRAAFDLEQTGQAEAALQSYRAAGTRWPGNATALMGAGNAAFALGRYNSAAESFFALASRHGVHTAGAWNNLSHALEGLGCPREARHAAARALALAPDEPAIRRTAETMAAASAESQQANGVDLCAHWRTRMPTPRHPPGAQPVTHPPPPA